MLPKVFVNSFPKGGTSLTVKLLELLGFAKESLGISSNLLLGRNRFLRMIVRGSWSPSDFVVIGVDLPTVMRASWVMRRLSRIDSGRVVTGHVRYSDHFAHIVETQGFKCIQVIRDPRDIVVSHAHYVSTLPNHFLYRHYNILGDRSARLAFSITGGCVKGVGYLESIDSRARSLEGWIQRPDVLTVRFEELVGARGGGSTQAQYEVLKKICTVFGVDASPTLIKEVGDSVFGGTRTFRKGMIGSWQEEFKDEHIRLFDEVTGDLLQRWGYSS